MAKPRKRAKVPRIYVRLNGRPGIISHTEGQAVWVSFTDSEGGQAKTTARALREALREAQR